MRRLGWVAAAAVFGVLVAGCQGDKVGEQSNSGGTAGASGGSAGASGSGAASGGGASGQGGAGGTAGSGGAGQPVILVPGTTGALGLAQDSTHLYYASGQSIWSVDKAGSTPDELAGGLKQPRELCLSGSTLFVVDGDKTIYAVPAAGGAPTPRFTGSGSFEQIGDIASDGVNVYWTTTLDKSSFDGEVWRMPVSGGAAETVTSLGAGTAPVGIAAGSFALYFANSIGSSIQSVASGGGTATTLASNLNKPAFVAIRDTWLYWTETDASAAFMQLPNGPAQLVDGASPGRGIALDATHVYWTSPSSGGLSRAALGSSTSTTLLQGYGSPWDIVVDDTAVYFTNGGGNEGAVVMLAK